MAETVSKIFEINTAPVVEQLSALGAQIESAKAKYNELKKAQGEYSEDTIKAKADVTALTKEYRSVQTVLDNNTKALYALDKTTQENLKTRQLEKNSIDTNRKLYNSLYNEIVKGKAPTQEQIKLAKELSDTLKKQESALGDTRRNVGNYAEGFKEAAKSISIFGVNASSVASGMQETGSAFKSAGGGVKGFSAALATTGLPLVIMAVQGLISVFENFKPVADAVENSILAIKSAFGALLGGGSIKEAIRVNQELLDTMRDLEDTQEAYNLQLSKSQGQIDKLIIQAKDRTKPEKERLELLKEAEKLELENYQKSLKRNDDLLIKQKAVLLNDLEINEEQLRILAESEDAENSKFQNIRKLVEKNTKFDEKALVAYQKTLQERAKLDADSNKFLEKIVNQNNKLIEKQEEEAEKAKEKAIARQEKLKEQREKRVAEEKESREKEEQEIKKHNDTILNLSNEFLLSERQKIEKSYQEKIDLLKGGSAEELALINAIRQEQEKKLKEFDDKVAKEQVTRKQKEINDIIALEKLKYDNAVAKAELEIKDKEALEQEKLRLSLFHANKQLELARQLAGSSPTAIEAENLKKLEIEIAKITAKINGIAESGTAKVNKAWGLTKEDVQQSTEALQSAQAIIGSIQDAINASYNIRRDEINATRDAEIRAIEQSGLSEEAKANKIKEVNKKAAMEEYEVQKKQFEINKAISIVQTIISTAMAVVAQLANPTPYAGIALAAAAAVAGAAQLAVIAAQKPPAPPKFAGGVIGLDGAGNEYSDSIDAKLSRGESVITAKATRRYAPLLASLEESVGNKPNWRLGNMRFATGYIPTGDGGFSARNMISTNNHRNLYKA